MPNGSLSYMLCVVYQTANAKTQMLTLRNARYRRQVQQKCKSACNMSFCCALVLEVQLQNAQTTQDQVSVGVKLGYIKGATQDLRYIVSINTSGEVQLEVGESLLGGIVAALAARCCRSVRIRAAEGAL